MNLNSSELELLFIVFLNPVKAEGMSREIDGHFYLRSDHR